jgi:site-specific recombinase XerC
VLVDHRYFADGVAKSVWVIGKGNKERQVPLPEAFGRVLSLSIAGKAQDEYLFAKKPGRRPCHPRLSEEAHRQGRHSKESHPAQAPAYLCDTASGKGCAAGRHSGLARA